MMKQERFTIIENSRLTDTVRRMILEGDTSAVTAPGQFVNIALPGRYLRRPISVCDAGDGRLTLVYKVVGEGTSDMAEMKSGTELDILTGLGNGFDISKAGDAPLLVGGGVGVPPMYLLAKKLIEAARADGADSCAPTVILGFNTKDEIFFEKEFAGLGCKVLVTTVDGSCGIQGYVTNAINERFSHYFACGPLPMLKALNKTCSFPGQLSIEERMGCGFGACMGCSIKVRGKDDGGQEQTIYKRVCKDGPVFSSEELLWEV